MNESTGLSRETPDSTILKCSMSLERRKEHWKLFYKQCQENHVQIDKLISAAHNLVLHLIL